MAVNKLKWAAIISFVVSMAVLLAGGYSAMDHLPPYPGKVVDSSGSLLFQKADILEGQGVYQRYGLMDHGSVWGHGSQRGMEFSAVTLHLVGDALSHRLCHLPGVLPADWSHQPTEVLHHLFTRLPPTAREKERLSEQEEKRRSEGEPSAAGPGREAPELRGRARSSGEGQKQQKKLRPLGKRLLG